VAKPPCACAEPDVHAILTRRLRCGIISYDSLDLALVCGTILSKQVVCIGLGRGVRVGIIEEVLNSKKDLLDGDRRLPPFFLVQDGEADGTGGVDVGVKERRDEFA
jgi:hypothetical protein